MRQVILIGAMLAGGSALAEDRALVIGNQNYADAADVTQADAAALAGSALDVAGFAVLSGADVPVVKMRALLSQVLLESIEDGRLVILLSGHFAQSGSETWFLGTDASVPDLAQIGAQGVSLATVLDIAATQSGGAVVLLGSEPRRLPLGPGLEPGIGPLVVPQGVTMIRGDAGRIADFAARTLGTRGTSLLTLLEQAPDLTADGFLSSLVPFRPADPQAPAVAPEGPDAEAIFWQSTREQGSPEAYDAYLKRFPKGRFADIARTEAARIRAEPGREARLAEDALVFSRDDRRAIQRALALLDLNPRGIDGLFGEGSRTAIAAWQKKNGHAATTFLTRDQVVQLLAQADARAGELEAQAALRKAELERQDQLYWNQTGAAGDEVGLRAYLKRYPDGMFAELAGARIEVFEAGRRDEAAANERAAWDLAVSGDSLTSYTDYLAGFPEGAFAAEAQVRIEELQTAEANGEDLAKWASAEDALGLSSDARQLIEGRLVALGAKPGEVDGVFDDDSRRAIRRFQAARELETTGYLDQETMVSLLADGILRLGD